MTFTGFQYLVLCTQETPICKKNIVALSQVPEMAANCMINLVKEMTELIDQHALCLLNLLLLPPLPEKKSRLGDTYKGETLYSDKTN